MDGPDCQGMRETMNRWAVVDIGVLQQGKTLLRPRIERTRDLGRGGEIQVPENLQIARQQATHTKIITEEPETDTWLNQEYADQDIGRELRNMANRKAHGRDDIPGEVYKASNGQSPQPRKL